jgi:hypothetical protein
VHVVGAVVTTRTFVEAPACAETLRGSIDIINKLSKMKATFFISAHSQILMSPWARLAPSLSNCGAAVRGIRHGA